MFKQSPHELRYIDLEIEDVELLSKSELHKNPNLAEEVRKLHQ